MADQQQGGNPPRPGDPVPDGGLDPTQVFGSPPPPPPLPPIDTGDTAVVVAVVDAFNVLMSSPTIGAPDELGSFGVPPG
jgi:hypothetical protein